MRDWCSSCGVSTKYCICEEVKMTMLKAPPDWYWVQDMGGAARPVWWDGKVFRDSPTAKEALAWNWPTFRCLGKVLPPTEAQIKAAATEFSFP